MQRVVFSVRRSDQQQPGPEAAEHTEFHQRQAVWIDVLDGLQHYSRIKAGEERVRFREGRVQHLDTPPRAGRREGQALPGLGQRRSGDVDADDAIELWMVCETNQEFAWAATKVEYRADVSANEVGRDNFETCFVEIYHGHEADLDRFRT